MGNHHAKLGRKTRTIEGPVFFVTFSENCHGHGVEEFLSALTAIRQAWPDANVKDRNVILKKDILFQVCVKDSYRSQQPQRQLWSGPQCHLDETKNPELRQKCMAHITSAVLAYKQEYEQQQQQQQQPATSASALQQRA